MIEAEPAMFAKLVPSVIDQYRQLSPDGYDSMVCNAIVADMTGKQIPLFLQRCTDFMTDPKGIDALNKVIDYINNLGNIARQQVKPVAGKAAAAPDAERAQFETERANFQKDQFRASSSQIIQSVFPSEWARATAGLKLTAQQEMRAKQLFGTDLQLILKNLPKVGGKTFDEQVQAFFKAGDKAGYAKFMEAAYRKYTPQALSNVLGDLGVAKRPGPPVGVPKPPVGTPPARPGQPPARTPSGPAAKKLSAPPKAPEIDYIKSKGMISSRKAYLKDGTLVDWSGNK